MCVWCVGMCWEGVATNYGYYICMIGLTSERNKGGGGGLVDMMSTDTDEPVRKTEHGSHMPYMPMPTLPF